MQEVLLEKVHRFEGPVAGLFHPGDESAESGVLPSQLFQEDLAAEEVHAGGDRRRYAVTQRLEVVHDQERLAVPGVRGVVDGTQAELDPA